MNTNKKNTVGNRLAGKATSTNHEGAPAYDMSDKTKLVNMVSTWLYMEPKFYNEDTNSVTHDEQIIGLIRKIAKNDYEFLLKTASYLRNYMNLRSAPQVLLAEAAMSNKGMPKVCVREYASDIIKRPDEMASIIAYVQGVLGDIGDNRKDGSLPKALKQGIAKVFLKFDEYQLQKYNNKARMVKLIDVARLVHPKPKNPDQAVLLRKLINDELQTPNTWNAITSAEGSSKESWNKALENMPYQARLMNLRNIIKNGANIKKAMSLITNPEAIKKSKMFPFAFANAYSAIEEFDDGIGNKDKMFVLDGLAKALEIASENLPKIPGTTVILADNSGSMSTTISQKGQTRAYEIADILLCMAHKMCERSYTMVFATEPKMIQISTRDSIMTNFNILKEQNNGGGTYAYKTIQEIEKQGIVADRIILLSDMQCYGQSEYSFGYGEKPVEFNKLLEEYRRKHNPKCILYSVNLCGYGTLQVPENDSRTCLIDGWSEKLLSYIPRFESDKNTMLQDIENTKPSGN